jgi:hypothetical protein
MILKIILLVATICFAIYTIVNILVGGSNALSEAMLYLAIFGIITGYISARLGMLFVFLCGSYLDVLKRFLVVGGSFNFNDVIKTLAVAPLATAAVFAGLLGSRFIARRELEPLPWIRLIIAMVTAAMVVAAALAKDSTMGSLMQSVANSALYVGLIAFAAMIYRTVDDQHRLFRFLLYAFTPVIIYGWVQLSNGYNSIEVAYAKSGMTVIDVPLNHPSLVEYKRVFSTMNSSVAYTLVGTILGIYAMIFGFGKGLLRRLSGFLFALVCFSSHIPGAGRTGWAIAIISFACYFIFRSKWGTAVTYIISITLVTVFLSNAEAIGEWLANNSQGMASSEFGERALNMGTFTSRTQGIAEWIGDKRYFSWFGLSEELGLDSRAHDLIGQIYVTTGVVGLAFSLIVGSVVLLYLHKRVFAIPDRDRRKLASFYLASVFAIIAGGVFSGSSLHVFPVNLYFWTILGMLFQLVNINRKELAGVSVKTARPNPEGKVPASIPFSKPQPAEGSA